MHSAGFLAAGQGQQQAAAAQFGVKLASQVGGLLLPETPQLVEQHQPPEDQGETDEHLQADLQHREGGGGSKGHQGPAGWTVGGCQSRRRIGAGPPSQVAPTPTSRVPVA